jgi:hypothetical protein
MENAGHSPALGWNVFLVLTNVKMARFYNNYDLASLMSL